MHASASTAAGAYSTVLTSEQVRLLAEIGFMAAGAGLGRVSEAIFDGLRVLRPQQPFPYIGLAWARQCAGRIEDAIRILREDGLRANPDNDEIQVFLGLALCIGQRSAESERVLSAVLAKPGPETPERKLARSCLGQIGRSGAGAPVPGTRRKLISQM
jgi:hypothetical protein